MGVTRKGNTNNIKLSNLGHSAKLVNHYIKIWYIFSVLSMGVTKIGNTWIQKNDKKNWCFYANFRVNCKKQVYLSLCQYTAYIWMNGLTIKNRIFRFCFKKQNLASQIFDFFNISLLLFKGHLTDKNNWILNLFFI